MRPTVPLLLVLTLAFAPSLEARRRSVGSGADVTTLPAAEWVKRFAVPFATDQPGTGFADLAPLGSIVGDARIVSLGEATHGTREFFTMKHRMLEYLVENMGFTVFAIEAALPEADAVNDYVLHGTGNPAQALAGMYFWTWNTQEVLDMIEWMRAYNLRRGSRPPVQFRGFDVQYSRGAIDRINAYLDRVDPAAKTQLATLWQCWNEYAFNSTSYTARSAQAKETCRTNLAQAHALIAGKRADYTARSSADEFEVILRYARVIQQDESVAANRGPDRDTLMAENIEWLADVAEPGEKLVLWAHNYHAGVATGLSGTTMGLTLRRAFPGREMVIFGFAFDRGSFNAINGGVLRANRVEPWTGGVEDVLRQAGHPRMFVDLRNIVSTPARNYFSRANSHWMIGAVFSEANPGNFRLTWLLSDAYDVLIWIADTTESRLLR